MKATVRDGNVEYHYEIIASQGQFEIQYAGNTVGVIQKGSTWQQISGAALPPAILKQLVLYIEAFFDRTGV
ncbi:hypothetical protein DJ568_14240 [Mucilaginibacter hurinus]|uniref:Uncharacterized protein n=1 Tax=Mucilaginibacter hurinus TaxID=2201324 RepID=A0A367GMX6_9SPHI|nr:hypothetical protein [Mucilaginibacter hurinus]RCH54043.1 hypothetical protein DJ568_14240 [Mucilaginibacter hurinus]